MIFIELPAERSKVGRLILQDDQGNRILGPFAALGKADDRAAKAKGNPDRDPSLPYGDTPLGSYTCHVQPPQQPTHSYGPNGTIALIATGGDALTAKKNGRSGLLIHGGDPGANHSLRPTHGCVRLYNEDIKLLVEALTSDSELGEHCTIKSRQNQEVAGLGQEALSFASSDEPLEEDQYSEAEAPALTSPAPVKSLVSPAPPAAAIIEQFTLDTDLKLTRSALTKEIIVAFFQSQPQIHRSLAEIADPVMAASTKYGVNAAYIVAHAIWETTWGTSTISTVKNNLFGYTAYDHNPLESATKFSSRAACVESVIPLIEKNYLQPQGKYFARKACLGNKSYGMNVHYATDANWGAGIASVARQIEKFARR